MMRRLFALLIAAIVLALGLGITAEQADAYSKLGARAARVGGGGGGGYVLATKVAEINSLYANASFTTPTFPNWGSTNVPVSDCTGLQNALSAGGSKKITAAGVAYNCLISITNADTWLYFEAGASVPYTTGGTAISVSASRVRVEFVDDAPVSNGIVIGSAITDVHFYGGHYLVNTGSRPADITGGCNRIAFEHLTLQITTGNNIVFWSAGCSNVILANSKSFQDAGGQANVRTLSMGGVLVMDSWLRNQAGPVGNAGQNLRTTCQAGPCNAGNQTTVAVWTRNIIDGGGLGDVVAADGTAWLYVTENHYNFEGFSSNFGASYPAFNNRQATNNTVIKWNNNASTFEGDASGGSWTNSGNTYTTNAALWSPVSSTLWNGTGTYQ